MKDMPIQDETDERQQAQVHFSVGKPTRVEALVAALQQASPGDGP